MSGEKRIPTLVTEQTEVAVVRLVGLCSQRGTAILQVTTDRGSTCERQMLTELRVGDRIRVTALTINPNNLDILVDASNEEASLLLDKLVSYRPPVN